MSIQKNSQAALPAFHDWPRTFRDAFTVTKALGIRYIWIDYVCVNQNDEEDWAFESSRMAAYYGNAALVIAASKARDSNDGCFALRNPLLVRPSRLNLRPDSPAALPFPCVWIEMNEYNDLPRETEPLHSRGWTFQEEILSRRLLRYASNKLEWRCLHGNVDDKCRWRFNNTAQSLTRVPELSLISSSNILHAPLESPHQRNLYYDAWYQMVLEFTTHNLTYQRDTLPALSGVAYELRQRMADNDAYVAGLWLKDLAVGLLWRISTIEKLAVAKLPEWQKNFDRHDFYSPSWSWVSMADRPIEYNLNDQILPGSNSARNLVRYLATESESNDFFSTQILYATVRPKSTQAPYGAVVAGSIAIRAQLASIKIELSQPLNNSESRRGFFEGGNDSTARDLKRRLTMDSTHFQTPPLSRKRGRKSFAGECTLDHIEALRHDGFDGQDCMEAYFLPLLAYHAENLGPPSYRCMGLAVVQSNTGQPDDYVRIGRASVDMDTMLYFRCSLPTVSIILV